jgi:hypothetical protein
MLAGGFHLAFTGTSLTDRCLTGVAFQPTRPALMRIELRLSYLFLRRYARERNFRGLQMTPGSALLSIAAVFLSQVQPAPAVPGFWRLAELNQAAGSNGFGLPALL